MKCLKGSLLLLAEQLLRYFKTPLSNFIFLFSNHRMCVFHTAEVLTDYKKQSLVTAEKALIKQQKKPQQSFKNKHNKTSRVYICIRKNKTNQKQTKNLPKPTLFFCSWWNSCELLLPYVFTGTVFTKAQDLWLCVMITELRNIVETEPSIIFVWGHWCTSLVPLLKETQQNLICG